MVRKSKAECSGCRDNFYNGNNCIGVEKCSNYSSASMVNRVIVSMSECPPFNRLEKVMSCYGRSGYAYLTNFDKIKRGPYKGQYCYGGDASHWENKSV